MTKVDENTIREMANLASVELTNEEVTKYTGEAKAIVSMIDMLQKIDTEGVVPTSQVSGLSSVTREDKVLPGVASKDLLNLAPETDKTSIKVPKVL